MNLPGFHVCEIRARSPGHCFFASKNAPGPISGSFKTCCSKEKLNKTIMPHISVFKKPRETCQMGRCSHGIFFATVPYRFHYRFVIVLVPSIRSHFRSPCKRLHSVLCKFLTPENSPYISNIPDRVLTVPHIMYIYIYVYYYYIL